MYSRDHCVGGRGEQEDAEDTEAVVLSIPRIEVTSYNEDGLPSYISFAEVRTLIIFIVLRESQDLNIDDRLILIVIKVTRQVDQSNIDHGATTPAGAETPSGEFPSPQHQQPLHPLAGADKKRSLTFAEPFIR